MPTTESQRIYNRDAKRRQRAKEAQALVVAVTDDDAAFLVESPDHAKPDALGDQDGATSPAEPFSGNPLVEQARKNYQQYLLLRLEHRRRRGLMIATDEARRQFTALARRIRNALDRAPSNLPADLSPEIRAAATTAMAAAIRQAMAAL